MTNNLVIGIGAGLVSALLFGVLLKGTGLAVTLYLLAPLPILIVGLGWSHRAALAAAATGSLVLMGVIQPFMGLAFAAYIAIPAWWLAYLALLGRRRLRASNGTRPGDSWAGSRPPPPLPSSPSPSCPLRAMRPTRRSCRSSPIAWSILATQRPALLPSRGQARSRRARDAAQRPVHRHPRRVGRCFRERGARARRARPGDAVVLLPVGRRADRADLRAPDAALAGSAFYQDAAKLSSPRSAPPPS